MMGFFLFTTVSRLALGPTQPLIQWVLGVLTLVIEQLRNEADHSAKFSAEVKNVWSCASTPSVHFHGLVLN